MNSSDKKFLIGYANKYYPISDHIVDLKSELDRCRLSVTKGFLNKEIEKYKKILSKGEYRLTRIYNSNPSGIVKHQGRYISISELINMYDGYSN